MKDEYLYLGVILIAVQFSFDSCVYLPSVVQYLKAIGAENPENYLFIVQAVSAAVQIVFSFIIGELAQLVGSIKWVVVTLFLISFAGNFLYSCGGSISLSAILGGRILCGAASSSGALIFSYISAVTSEKAMVFKLLSLYRTSAGVCMAISELIAILLSFCNFKIGNYKINSTNAPTFVSSFIILIIGLILCLILENPEIKSKDKTQSFQKALYQFFSTGRSKLVSCMILLWCMFLSSFIMSEVMYFTPVFLTQHIEWSTKFQGVSFMVACLIGVAGSYFAPLLASSFASRNSRELLKDDNDSDSIEKLKTDEERKKQSIYFSQVFISIFALLISLIGQVFMIAAYECLKNNNLPRLNCGIFFVAGITITMLSYNFLASSIPSIFSLYVDPRLRVQLMPFIGAISGLGKLVSPIVLAALYKTNSSMSLAVGVGMILVGISIPFVLWIKVIRY